MPRTPHLLLTLITFGTLLTTPLAAQERAMIVLDASGSMWGQIDGRSKIEIARDTMAGVLAAVPEGNELGLIVYGHRERGACDDIELAVPPATGTASAIADVVARLQPKGKTPLTAAVRQAAEAMRYTEDPATVILVTDGLETCEADPCAVAAELEAAGVNFTAHVVGFGLTAEEGAQVACLAEATGGTYLAAENAGDLATALTQTVVAAPTPEVVPAPAPAPEAAPAAEPEKPEFNLRATASLTEGGPDLTEATRWDLYPVVNGEVARESIEGNYDNIFQIAAPPGDYELALRSDNIERRLRLTLTDMVMTEPHIVLDAGWLTVRAYRSAGGEMADGARIEATGGGVENGSYTEARWLLPAGPVTVLGRQGAAIVTQETMVVAGQDQAFDIVVGTGVVRISALYAPGGPVVEDQLSLDVQTARTDLKGNRDSVAGGYGAGDFDVPAGEFVVAARLEGAEVLSAPFTVDAGAMTEVQVVLNAGVAAITATAARKIEVFGPPDLKGERDSVTFSYDAEFAYTLTAGDYLARAEYDGDKAPTEAAFTVTAGARVEVALP